jgi:hypothetical protein
MAATSVCYCYLLSILSCLQKLSWKINKVFGLLELLNKDTNSARNNCSQNFAHAHARLY